MPPVEIRLLTAADASAFWALRLEALETEPAAFSASADDHRMTNIADTATRLEADPANNFVAGAFEGGVLLGTAGFYRERGSKLQHKGHVWGVFVTARVRRAGAGRSMLRFLLDRAAGIEGLEQIVLTVATTQTSAIRLYESLGFRAFGTEPRALRIGDRYVDQLEMMIEVG